MKSLTSTTWAATSEKIRKCHLSLLSDGGNTADWVDAFDSLIDSIKDERKLDPAFSPELGMLTKATGITYDFADILEEYFDHLEESNEWEKVISSCEKIIDLFKWESALPSEYMFRKGNALEKSGRYEEAEAFGKEWLEKYPTDLYGAASNTFLLLELGRVDEAEAITEKYLRDDLICNDDSNTLYMAAYRLYEMTENINAKQRVEKKMAEYQELINK